MARSSVRTSIRVASPVWRRTQTASRSPLRSPPAAPREASPSRQPSAAHRGARRSRSSSHRVDPSSRPAASAVRPRPRGERRPAHASHARGALRVGDRDRRRGDRRGARSFLVVAGGPARGDRQARHQPADGSERTDASSGKTAELPLAAPGMIARIGPVDQVQYTGSTSANVYRSPLIPAVNTNALSVQAASLGLPQTVGATVGRRQLPQRRHRATAGRGARLRRSATAGCRPTSTPASASGSAACGSTSAGSSTPPRSPPRSTASVLVGFAAAKRYLGFDGHPTTIYLSAR